MQHKGEVHGLQYAGKFDKKNHVHLNGKLIINNINHATLT